jgi:hypothetical protein
MSCDALRKAPAKQETPKLFQEKLWIHQTTLAAPLVNSLI